MTPKKIGISIGDINGIGLEVILKALRHPQLLKYITPVLYGSEQVVSYHKNLIRDKIRLHGIDMVTHSQHGKVNVVNCWQEEVDITLGKPTKQSGKYAFLSLENAVADLKNRSIDALVTSPINKEAMKMADFAYPGHTEYLNEKLGAEASLMLMVFEELRIGVVTGHLPLREVAARITRKNVLHHIKLIHESLRVDFGQEQPTIAVLGLNPHAGDHGVIGLEDQEIVRPAIEAAKKEGILAMGPYPADGLFGSGNYQKFDAILAMYHDQGLIPFKTIASGHGVNFTAGLSAVRTSPDHGTAFDIAGQNKADASSFRAAMYTALDILRRRHDYLRV